MGLHDSPEPGIERGIEGAERQGASRSGRSGYKGADQGWPAAAWVRLVEGRRHNGMRKLDLFGVVYRSRQSDGAARSVRSLQYGRASWLGMVLAGKSARAL